MKRVRKTFFTLVLGVAVGSVGFGLQPSLLVGQLAGPGASVDGAVVPSGTNLMTGATLTTADEPVTVHFHDGTMVRLASDSSGRFERVSSSAVQVAVLSGAMAFQDAEGAVRTAGEGTTIQLDSEPPTGDRESEEVDVCHLVDPEPEEVPLCTAEPREEECEWDRIEVELELLGEHMAANPADIPVDEELRELHRGPDLRLPGACRKGFFIIPVWAAAGGGTLASGVVLNEIVSNDPVVDETSLSPIQN